VSVVERSVLVPYSAAQMFELVAAVEQYPRFLPWCSGVQTEPDRPGRASRLVTLDIDYRGVRTRFTTRNVDEPARAIYMALVDGPFRQLSGQWRFTPVGEQGSRVELSLQFLIAGGVLSRMIAPVFESIAESMIDAFSRRAEDLYGEG
jgi:ribosome-associated toxin RatA of RatAB toxin-antitoxin module